MCREVDLLTARGPDRFIDDNNVWKALGTQSLRERKIKRPSLIWNIELKAYTSV